MMVNRADWLVIAAITGLWVSGPLQAQENRRGRTEPGLIVETGARMAACDALRFTPDGEHLLAAGDDKVVRSWRFSEQGLDLHAGQALRWSIWREQRGAIYALALSPDRAAQFLAIGGYGIRTGSVVVLNRGTGEIEHALTNTGGNTQVVWSLAFAPSGKQLALGTDDGSIWLWDLRGRANDVKKLGQHPGQAGSKNRIRLLEYRNATQLWSVAADGNVYQWNVAGPGAAPTLLHRFKSSRVFRASLSRDHRWLAAAGEEHQIELVLLDGGKTTKLLPLPDGHFPHSLAFDDRGERLAAGIRVVPRNAQFFKEADGRVVIFDLRQATPRENPGLKTAEHAEAIAFHPSGNYLASAGGPDHEVALHRIDGVKFQRQVGQVIRSPGGCIYSVALSADGLQLGFKDQRVTDPSGPNRRGAGPWRVYQLQNRGWAHGDGFNPVEPLETVGGWTVQPSNKDAHLWYALGPNKVRHELPLDRWRDGMPRCYTFLNPTAVGKPVRLAVGHYWGLSVFELTAKEARRIRLYTGHQGEVLALAPSADHKILVSAARDQTIAAWSLAPWPSEDELGAAFTIQGGKLLVSVVDPGSPAWEAGLSKGDELFGLHYNGKPVEGGAAKWLERLRQPVPGRELYWRSKRAGQAQEIEQLTTVRQRPLWRFFATRDREWIIWRHRDYYYDTSTNGDSYIGWQVNGEDVDQKPTFYRAEQFRNQFHQPRKIAEALTGMIKDPDRVSLIKVEPPDVKVELSAREVKDTPITLSMTITPRGKEEAQQPDRVILWVNDFQLESWKAAGSTFKQKVSIPPEKLRAGANLLTVQCYCKAGGRGEIYPPATVHNSRPQAQPSLYGIFVGVGDYSRSGLKTLNPKHDWNLNANRDMEVLRRAWLRQENVHYKAVDIQLLVDAEVTRASFMARLEKVASRAKPDDVLALVIGGHGASAEVLSEFLRLTKTKPIEALAADNFVFCCSDFDPRRPLSTGITSQSLYQVLTRLPCRKVVLLDACRSGTMVVNPVRQLTHDGVGPIILAASQSSQDAIENPKGQNTSAGTLYGLFSLAVVRALLDQFDRADKDNDLSLLPEELFDFVRSETSVYQDAAKFLPSLERRMILAKKR